MRLFGLGSVFDEGCFYLDDRIGYLECKRFGSDRSRTVPTAVIIRNMIFKGRFSLNACSDMEMTQFNKILLQMPLFFFVNDLVVFKRVLLDVNNEMQKWP